MQTNFKNKIRSADIVYEIYPVSISVLSSSMPIFIIIYSVKLNNIIIDLLQATLSRSSAASLQPDLERAYSTV